ncbi:response regulator [Bdellovibrio bacteriovorus]|uniref:histidine kinase n=2 Tax=Bdellovibrio bacteriovorus TaxID=959 RepID=A0A1Z3NBL2_BDEBC|nr:hybrid sensor histidine kinase/response regulator [Bdellovibrio bacteriovorus]
MGIRRFWKYLSVANKLYIVIGVMALLIALELFTLYFAMNSLSSVRAFVAGESMWSKGQKDAVITLHKYARTRDPQFYTVFQENVRVPLGDSKARNALEQVPPDTAKAKEGLLEGKVHPDDIPGVISLVLRFHNFKHVKKALEIWREGDQMTQELIVMGENLHMLIQKNAPESEIFKALNSVDDLNDRLTVLEASFSYTLGEGSRWLENMLMVTLIFAVLIVEGTGLFLTISFSRNLSKGLSELNNAAHEVGEGRFDVHVPVRSGDELGQLAESINLMAHHLSSSIGERQQAEQASQLKSLFLANMSHEIRTPLAAIIGFSDLLKESNLDESERLQYVNIIHRTGEHLTRIINDILDLSKVEAGHLEMQSHPVNLNSLLEDLHILMVARVGDKPVHVEFNRRGIVPDMIRTDPLRLRQILTNIIGNAIKFTDQGYVRMTYEISGNNLLFTIKDTGVGISSSQRSNLFQAFSQIDNSVSRKYEGTGLGLVLSRRLAQMMGGDVVLEDSEPGKGCTFIVKIALDIPKIHTAKIAPAPAKEVHLGEQLSSTSILLVDDVEDNRLLIQRMLAKRGANLTLATNGQEGLTKALEKEFDIILMDIQMPVMDGYTATRKLRQAGYSKPIIALTAHAMKDDRERCLEAGCTDYLTKPVQVESLIHTILTYSMEST